MRAYFFGNMYLSSIQQGIQAAHCLAEMYEKYRLNPKYEKQIEEWAINHKTMILLNGGYSETIRNLHSFFWNTENPYPFASFCEGEDALDGALTCVGIILPEKIYNTASLFRTARFAEKQSMIAELHETGTLTTEEGTLEFNKFEAKLLEELNNYSLAS